MRINKTTEEHTAEDPYIRYMFQPVVSLRDGSIFGHSLQTSLHLQNNEAVSYAADVFFRCTADDCILLLPPDYITPFDLKIPDGMSPERIVYMIRTPGEIRREMINFAVILDDVNTVFPLRSFSECRPKYVVLAASVVCRFKTDVLFYSFVKSVVEFCHGTDVDIIAEGAGSQKELAGLIELGVAYAQGAFIREPTDLPCVIRKDAYEFIVETNRSKNHINGLPTDVYIANLCMKTQVLSPDMLIETVYEMVRNDADCIGYCVVKDGDVLGILTRNNLIFRMSGRYGFMLYQKKAVSTIMDSDFLSADYKTPVNQVSELAMRRNADRLYDFIVVKKNGKYYGTVTVRDLLLKSTEIQIAHARLLNPLTGLPGNTAIEDTLSGCISTGTPYCVLYIDINNFKAYNDVYGFENGDEVIQQLARDITGSLAPGQFAGHIGGDDFVVVLLLEKAEEYCAAVIESFTQNLSGYYTDGDFRRGFITTENRRGVVENFPLLSLAVAGVFDSCQYYSDTRALTEELARLKKLVKQNSGSSFYIERK